MDLAIFKLLPAKAKRLRAIDDRLAELRPQAPAEFGPADEAYDPVLRELYILEMDRLGLIRRHGELLDFGTPFDHGDATAAAAHLERELASRPLNGAETRALHNRRLLYGVMVAAGFQAYPDEWWHFNATQSQMGARTAGLTHAAYGAAHFSQDNREHEIMRTMHRKGLGIIYKAVLGGVSLRGRGAVMDDLVALNELALRRTGDPHATGLPKAAVIEAAA